MLESWNWASAATGYLIGFLVGHFGYALSLWWKRKHAASKARCEMLEQELKKLHANTPAPEAEREE